MENRLLKPGDLPASATDRLQELRIGLGVGLGQFRWRNADRLRSQVGLVDSGRVVQDGREAPLLHVAADPLDDLDGRERLAEDLDGPFAALLADDVSPRTEPPAKPGHRRPDVVLPTVNTEDLERIWGHQPKSKLLRSHRRPHHFPYNGGHSGPGGWHGPDVAPKRASLPRRTDCLQETTTRQRRILFALTGQRKPSPADAPCGGRRSVRRAP